MKEEGLKILLVTPFLPYSGVPHAGGKLVYYLLCTLAERHSVFLVSRYFGEEKIHFPALRKMVAGLEVVSAEGPIRPGSVSSLLRTVASYRRLARKAVEVLGREKFDVCQVEHTETGVFWKPPPRLPAILTCHDVIAKPAFRRYSASRGIHCVVPWLTWRAARIVEKRSLSKFRLVFTLSDEDKEWTARLYPATKARVLHYPGGIGFTGLPRCEVPNRVLFAGALNRPQNIEAVKFLWEKVWPAVRAEVHEAELWVAGGGAPTSLVSQLSGDPRVKVTGYTGDLEGLYKSAAVFAAPISTGGGIIVKILDAMAAGVPVVTTSYGNEGIRGVPGKDLLIADRPEEFAHSVISLLKDDVWRKMLGESARWLVEERSSAPGLMDTIEGSYREMLRE
ncbi:MAG: glycosyltransferase [Candidatus Deferrimicrobiaceae bacterium]